MMSAHAGDVEKQNGEEASILTSENNSLLRTASGKSGVTYYRGPMTVERISEIKSWYLGRGWRFDAESVLLSFVSPCGRWYECYDTATSQFYCIDGDWTVNLKVTRKSEDDGVL